MDAGDLTLMPAFADSHEHLMEASRNTLLVPVDQAKSIAEFTGMVANAARNVPSGGWILTSIAWHESNFVENRLPSLDELDAAAPGHPVLARRGGHLAVANSVALDAAGIDPSTPDPPGGRIGRNRDGTLDGVLEGGAVYQVMGFAPPPGHEDLASALGTASASYAALGVGTIREAMVTADDLSVYRHARRSGELSVRVRPLIRVGNELPEEEAVAMIHGLDTHSGDGDDWLRTWGLKFVMDGGVEGGAMEQPYDNDPTNSGHLNWDKEVMTRICADAVERGWRIGTHAAGDRAVGAVLDVYEGVVASTPAPAPWTLVIEHALVTSPAQRERAVRGGFGITVQHALLWNMGSEMVQTWGPERTRNVNPLDSWLALGAHLAAGTDIVRPFNPMTNVWGMATRGTKAAGTVGAEHAIPVATALDLYTRGTASLNGDTDRLGTVQPGKLADLVGYRIDPMSADLDDLAELTPAFTMVGGRLTYDADGRLGSQHADG
jgi:predicted amidohydrolase YtcJ